MKRLLLIRHAQSVANSEGRIQGWLDSPLSRLGREHAIQLGNHLAHEFMITHVFTSPLSRAAETAMQISLRVNLPLIYHPALKERNVGPISGLTKYEVQTRFPEVESAWMNNRPRPHLDGAETDEQFSLRVQTAIDFVLADTAPDTTSVVVSHGGTLNQMLKNWFGFPFLRGVTFSFSNTSLTIIEIHEALVRLVALNDTGHLHLPHYSGELYAQRNPDHA